MTKAPVSKNKGGRPRDPVRRVPLSLRVTPEVRTKLEALADASGRSISQEAEFRLEQSFHDEDLVPGALSWAYGSHLTGVMLAVGEIVKLAGPLVRTEAKWSVHGGKVVQSMPNKATWDESDDSKRSAAKCSTLLIELLLNPGFLSAFEKTDLEARIETYGELPIAAAMMALGGLRGEPNYTTEQWQRIRALIGDIAPKPPSNPDAGK